MYKKRVLITNFNRGMVSPRYSGRVDTNLAQTAVEEMEGFIVHPDGGIARRRGTIYGKSGIGVSPGDGIPAFVAFHKRNTLDGYEVVNIAYAQDNSGTYQLVLKNLSTGVENVITNAKFEEMVGEALFTSGKMNNVYVLKSTSPALAESTATLSERTNSYNPTDYSRVYGLPADFYLDYYLESGEVYELFESKGTTYLATDDTSPTLNYADVSKDTQSAALSTASVPYPTNYTYVYGLPEDCEHVFYIDSENTEYEVDETVRSIYTDTANPVLHYTDIEDLYGFDFIYNVPGDFYSADSIDPDTEYLVYTPDNDTLLFTSVKPSNLTLHYRATTASDFNEYLHIWTDDISFLVDLGDYSLDGGDEKTDQEISTLFQNRLIAFERDMGKLWMSAPYSYLDFTGSGHLNLEPDFYGAEKPQWIKSQGSVYMGTDKSEYMITSSLPYFSDELGGLILQKISNIGSDMAEYFGNTLVMAKDRRLVQISYQGANQYQSNSLAELIDNKSIRNVVSMDFGSHRYFCFVDADDDLYVFTEAQSSGVSAWTRIMRNVGWISAVGQDLYVSVERDGAYYLEILPFDNIQHPGGRSENLTKYFWDVNRYGDKGGFIYAWDDLSGEHMEQDILPESSSVEVYELPGNTYIGSWTTDADGLLEKSATQVLTDTGHTEEGGEVFLYAYLENTYPQSTIKTLPLYIPVQTGLEYEQPRRINKVILKVLDSMAAKVRVNEGTWEEWNGTEEYTGVKEFWVDGSYSDEVQVEIQAVDDKPLHILSVEAEVTVGE